MQHLTTQGKFSPSCMIQHYLGIKLNEEHPFISRQENKILAKSYEKTPSLLQTKANQIHLFHEIIGKLNDTLPLVSFTILKMQNISVSNSSSSESIGITTLSPTDKTLETKSVDIFETHLKTIKTTKLQKNEYKTKIILATARVNIDHLSCGDPILEDFHRKQLANALNAHVKLYIEPLKVTLNYKPRQKKSIFITSSIPLEEKISDEEVLKKLQIKNLDLIMGFWVAMHGISETKRINLKTIHEIQLYALQVKKISEKETLKQDELLISKQKALELKQQQDFQELEIKFKRLLQKKINEKLKEIKPDDDKKWIKDYKILETPRMNDLIAIITPEELKKQALDLLANDIFRQLSYIEAKDQSKHLKSLQETLPSKTEISFEKETSYFKSLILFLLRKIASLQDISSIIDEFDRLKIDSEKNEESFSEFTEAFLHFLKSTPPLIKESFQIDHIKKKLYFLLTAISQKTYSLMSIFISQLLFKYTIQNNDGKDATKLLFHFKENELLMTSSHKMRLIGKSEDDLELHIRNSLVLKSFSQLEWKSTPSIDIILKKPAQKTDFQKNIIDLLQSFGFDVHVE